jgi:signal transduction histidine kinase
MSKSLPPNPSVRQLKIQAKNLLKSHKNGDANVCETLKLLPRFTKATSKEILKADVSLKDVQFAIALSYGFENWKALKDHIEREQKIERLSNKRWQQFLAFGKHEKCELTPDELRQIITEGLEVLRTIIPATIEIRHNISKDIKMIMGNPIQINQLLLNLCDNASRAMQENGGILNVCVDSVYIDGNDRSKIPGLNTGNYVKLSITDTGQGMGQEQLPQIFEPYYTTKKIGEGTGLGLPMVYSIVKQHSGYINIRSQVGKGTTVGIYFPVVEGESRKETEKAEAIA